MITGVLPHPGGKDLARHLAKLGRNELIEVRLRGIPEGSLEESLQNLALMAIGANTKTPLVHVHANPSRTYSEREWEIYWEEFERVFHLEHQPYAEARHANIGRNRVAPHRHRAYLRVLPNRKLISLSNSFLRSERVSRWAEFTNGERLVKGRFNLAVEKAFRADGLMEIADAMKKAGLLDGGVTIATKPHERQMTERAADLSKDEVCRRIWQAWSRSDDGASFVTALREAGLTLARGDKLVVAVTARGVIHPLRRALRMGAAEGRQTPVTSAELDKRLSGLGNIPAAEDVIERTTSSEVLGALQATGAVRSSRKTMRTSGATANDGRRLGRVVREPMAATRGRERNVSLQKSGSESSIRALGAEGKRTASADRNRDEIPGQARQIETSPITRPHSNGRPSIVATAQPTEVIESTPRLAQPRRRAREFLILAPPTAGPMVRDMARTKAPRPMTVQPAAPKLPPVKAKRVRQPKGVDRRNLPRPVEAPLRSAIPVPPFPWQVSRGKLTTAVPESGEAPKRSIEPYNAASHRTTPVAPNLKGLARTEQIEKPGRSRVLTAAQEAAVANFLTALEGDGAAKEVAAMRRAAEAAADQFHRDQEAAQRAEMRRAAARAALRDLEADLLRPSIGQPSWKDAFKAELAGLPRDADLQIRWVETAVANRTIVTLQGGETVNLMADRATGFPPSTEVARTMVEHALAQKWPCVVFSGGTAKWREIAARLATRRGLKVENPELATIVGSERETMRLEQLVGRWRSARDAVAWEPESTGLREQFIASIEALRSETGWRSATGVREQSLIEYDLIQLALREASLEGSTFRPHQFEMLMTGAIDRSGTVTADRTISWSRGGKVTVPM